MCKPWTVPAGRRPRWPLDAALRAGRRRSAPHQGISR